ncbi:MAG: ABC transporter permease [Candidatus Thermoplasmatota archaeon]|nr:ABC transporter permease [Candidatus Thermoplasmatota archaeon]
MDLKRTAAGIVALTLHSTKKLLLSRKVVITFLVAAFVALVMGYAGTQEFDPLEAVTDLMDRLILFFFMPVMAMIFGSSLIRDEIDDMSITHVATAPLDRVYSYIGYYLPLVITVMVSVIVIATAGFLAFFAQHDIGAEAVEIYCEFTILIVLGSIVYSSLFLAISVFFKKPVFFGLFYAFVWEGMIGSLPGVIQKVSVKHYLRSMGSEWIDYGDMSGFEEATGLGDSVIVLALLTAAFLVIGAYLFRNKELC